MASNWEAVDIYNDPAFLYFRSAFDSMLKEFHRKVIGITTKQAQV